MAIIDGYVNYVVVTLRHFAMNFFCLADCYGRFIESDSSETSKHGKLKATVDHYCSMHIAPVTARRV